MTRVYLRVLGVVAGVVALITVATIHLGAIGALLVIPAALLLAFGAFVSSDAGALGRSLADSHEKRADLERRWNQASAAEQLERAADILEAFVDDDSADRDIERLRAEAYWARKRGGR